MKSVKVVFHIDEVDKWPLLLANVRNLVKVVDVPSSQIVVLANAKAVTAFNGGGAPEHQQAIADLSASGVAILACQNSLNGLKISAAQLPGFVAVVPVGVLTLIEKQSQGFAYIKP